MPAPDAVIPAPHLASQRTSAAQKPLPEGFWTQRVAALNLLKRHRLAWTSLPADDRAPDAQRNSMADPTVADVAKQLGETQTALNIVWTLIAAFLVMFMQAGF